MEDNQNSSQNTNNSKMIIGVVVVLIVVVAGYFLFKNESNTPSVQNQVTPSQDSQTQTVENQVTIQNFSFTPGVITVKVGTTVTWINQDDTNHTATGTGGAQEFNSDNLTKGQSYSHTFSAAGEFNYLCSLHPNMQGKVTVTQ